MSSFVLVHGAWGGGWAWKKGIPLLRAAGHDVHAPTATGLGDRVHLAGPAVDLDTHITDVANVLAFEDLTEVTLVGWSYGGMIITGVAERVPERLAQLVYLDALVPADGENSYDAERSSEEVRAAADAAGMPGFLLVEPYLDWLGSLTPGPADRAWLLARLVPQPLATYTQPISLRNPAAAAVPRTSSPSPKARTRQATSSRTPRPDSNLLRAGNTESSRTTTWRRSTRRRPRPKCCCRCCGRHTVVDTSISPSHIGGTSEVTPWCRKGDGTVVLDSPSSNLMTGKQTPCRHLRPAPPSDQPLPSSAYVARVDPYPCQNSHGHPRNAHCPTQPHSVAPHVARHAAPSVEHPLMAQVGH
jgi:pimeloyl-ACP methyl ester carboxylesterase